MLYVPRSMLLDDGNIEHERVTTLIDVPKFTDKIDNLSLGSDTGITDASATSPAGI